MVIPSETYQDTRLSGATDAVAVGEDYVYVASPDAGLVLPVHRHFGARSIPGLATPGLTPRRFARNGSDLFVVGDEGLGRIATDYTWAVLTHQVTGMRDRNARVWTCEVEDQTAYRAATDGRILLETGGAGRTRIIDTGGYPVLVETRLDSLNVYDLGAAGLALVATLPSVLPRVLGGVFDPATRNLYLCTSGHGCIVRIDGRLTPRVESRFDFAGLQGPIDMRIFGGELHALSPRSNTWLTYDIAEDTPRLVRRARYSDALYWELNPVRAFLDDAAVRKFGSSFGDEDQPVMSAGTSTAGLRWLVHGENSRITVEVPQPWVDPVILNPLEMPSGIRQARLWPWAYLRVTAVGGTTATLRSDWTTATPGAAVVLVRSDGETETAIPPGPGVVTDDRPTATGMYFYTLTVTDREGRTVRAGTLQVTQRALSIRVSGGRAPYNVLRLDGGGAWVLDDVAWLPVEGAGEGYRITDAEGRFTDYYSVPQVARVDPLTPGIQWYDDQVENWDPGVYRLAYASGAINVQKFLPPGVAVWRTRFAVAAGARFVHDDGAVDIVCPGPPYPTYPASWTSVAAAEAANAGYFLDFTHAGGKIGIYFQDVQFDDNDPNTALYYQLTRVVAVPTITSPLSATWPSGVPVSYQITATNSPSSYGATGLPAGVAINTGTGEVYGTLTFGPNESHKRQITVTAINGVGTSDPVVVTLVDPIDGAIELRDGYFNVSGTLRTALTGTDGTKTDFSEIAAVSGYVTFINRTDRKMRLAYQYVIIGFPTVYSGSYDAHLGDGVPFNLSTVFPVSVAWSQVYP